MGADIYGLGFTLTPIEREQLISKRRDNAERIFPYLGGEEVNSDPTQSHGRYVINFGEMSLQEASRWPDLLDHVRREVKPERDKLRDNADGRRLKQFWWRFNRTRPELFAALAKLERCLVISIHTKHLGFSFQPTNRLFSHAMLVFALDRNAHFSLLQSRIHEAWARLLSSTMEDRLRYSISECFETFPFPTDAALSALEPIGKSVYDARAQFMVETNQGLTDTYNLLKDPHCDSTNVADVERLRALHEQLDRDVIAAYGWHDIVVPPYCPRTDTDRIAVARFEDAVIDRLFALNADRAAAEAKAAGKVVPTATKQKVAKAAKKTRGAKNQISMLDDE